MAAPAPVILGTLNMVESAPTWGYDPQRGVYTKRVWKGHKSQVGSITQQLLAYGYKFDVLPAGGDMRIIEASIAAIDPNTSGTDGTVPNVAGNEVTSTWELAPNKSTKDILHADCSAIAALTKAEKDEIKYYLQNPPPPNSSPDWTNSGTRQDPIYHLMMAGVEHWEIDQPVLRHTYVVPPNVDPGLSFTNIGKIFATQSLHDTEGLPTTFKLSITGAASQFSNPTRTDGVSLVYGWRKSMPTLTASFRGKAEVRVEYVFGLWSTVLYGTAI